MENNFLKFVSEILGLDSSEVTMDMKYKEGNWDSIAMMTLVMELEAEYDASLPIESIQNVKTMQDLYDLTFQGRV